MLALLALALCAGALAWRYEPRVEAALRLTHARARVLERRELLLEVAEETGVDVHLLGALMMAESSGRADARSHKGALGLFQLMPATAAEQAQRLGLPPPDEQRLLADARLNARLGARYLAWLLARQQGDAERALIAYNAGPGRLARWIDESGTYETWRAQRAASGSPVLAYATKVLSLRDDFREHGLFEPDADSPDPSAPPPGLAAELAEQPTQRSAHSLGLGQRIATKPGSGASEAGSGADPVPGAASQPASGVAEPVAAGAARSPAASAPVEPVTEPIAEPR
jgi:hypothetical protein